MLTKVDKFIEKLATYLLVLSVMSIIAFSLFEIILRQFQVTYLWIGPFIRHLVFLCSFLGATIATGTGDHIRIDVLSRILDQEKFIAKVINIITVLSVLLVSVWLTVASYEFFSIELQYGKETFWGLHSSTLTFIAPFGFGLITLRFFHQLVLSIKKLK